MGRMCTYMYEHLRKHEYGVLPIPLVDVYHMLFFGGIMVPHTGCQVLRALC